MATSKIKIYQTVLTPSRNALVDDLEDYLNSLTPTYSNDNFQYVKFDLDIFIKIPVPQNVISGHSIGNYIRIEQDNKIWYYFIMNTDWKAFNTVQLKLSIDSINTFRNDLTFSNKTLINRQHKDRLIKQDAAEYFIRTIDPVSEQISADKIRYSTSTIGQSNLNTDWYLIYKTRDDLSVDNPGNPISCLLCPKDAIKIAAASEVSSKTYTYADFNEGIYYYFNDLDNPNGIVNSYTIKQEHTAIVDASTVPQTKGTVILRGIVLYRQGTALYYAYQFDRNIGIYNTAGQAVLSAIGPAILDEKIVVQRCNLTGKPFRSIDSITITKGNFFRYSSNYYEIPEQAYIGATQTMAAYIGQTAVYTNKFADVDRTDSKLVKIIKLPYAPCNVTYNNGIYTFPSDWTYDNGYMRLNDASLSTEFLNKNLAQIAVSELFVKKPTVFSPTAAKNIIYESKLYHSDFYDFKFVYDSFVKTLQLERYETNRYDENIKWKPNNAVTYITFKPTNTINSNFAFEIDPNLTDPNLDFDFAYYQSTSDYQDYLIASRNNEETIFSNDYLNYIRTGYNYDKKTKQKEIEKGWLSSGIQLAAGIASFAASGLTGGVSAASGIALVSGAISSFASNAYTQSGNERAIQSKLASLANQSSGVVGSDDIDLLSFYNKNRLLLIKYETEYEQRKALFNYFFYCGYKCDKMLTPNITSRYWFNFIQCKAIFTEEGVTPYNDYIDDVKARYNAGVTVYHHHTGIGTEWDWQQEYENWEVSLMN